MNGSELQTPSRSSPGSCGVDVGAHADREHDRVVHRRERASSFARSIRRPRTMRAPSPATSVGLLRQRMVLLAVRRDREANQAARLLPLVVDRDLVAARGELAGAGEPGRPGADHGDPEARRRARGGEAGRPSASAASAA